jgi:hypothetical protein
MLDEVIHLEQGDKPHTGPQITPEL